MNKFAQLVEALKSRAEGDEALKKLLPDTDAVDPPRTAEDVPEQAFRLPYSSEPKPVEEPWN